MILLRIWLEGNISNQRLPCNSHRYCRRRLQKPSGHDENNAGIFGGNLGEVIKA